MSYTSVYRVYKTKVRQEAELHNGWGSGPALWEYISQKLESKKFNLMNPGNFWDLWKDARLTKNERVVLLSTYDRSFVEIEKLKDFVEACKDVHELILSGSDWRWNHFADIAKAAERVDKKHDYRCIGIAINCTSVADDWIDSGHRNFEPWGVYSAIEEMIGSVAA